MKFCPECGANLAPYQQATPREPRSQEPYLSASASDAARAAYNQDETWRMILSQEAATSGPLSVDQVLAASNVEKVTRQINRLRTNAPDGVRTIVHALFDREVTPTGGVLYRATMTNGRGAIDVGMLEKAGYVVENNKVVTADNVPVGKAWNIFHWWGGRRQHHRWHLAEPVEVNPSRLGDPLFIDDRLAAFGVTWKDSTKLRESLHALLCKFAPTDGPAVAIPTVLHLCIWPSGKKQTY